MVDRLDDVPLPAGTLLNVNVPAGEVEGVEVARLGKRVYQDRLDLIEEDVAAAGCYRVYGDVAAARRRARAPTSRRSPPAGSRSRRCTST